MHPHPSNYSGPYPVTLVTGYRGLAETILTRLSQKEFPLSVLVRREDRVSSLRQRFPSTHFYVGDVAQAEDCQNWITEASERWGRIDALINNAAIPGPPGRLGEICFESFVQAVEVNLLGPIRLCQLALPYLLRSSRGTLVNLSGGGATQARPRFSAYATAKCGLVRFTECLAAEYPELGIYSVSPGALSTPMMEKIAAMDPSLVGPEQQEARRRLEEGAEDPNKAASLIEWLLEKRPHLLRGRLISAIWDDYRNEETVEKQADWWTLRRVDEICLKKLKSLS